MRQLVGRRCAHTRGTRGYRDGVVSAWESSNFHKTILTSSATEKTSSDSANDCTQVIDESVEIVSLLGCPS